jgi:hypothetical protein
LRRKRFNFSQHLSVSMLGRGCGLGAVCSADTAAKFS